MNNKFFVGLAIGVFVGYVVANQKSATPAQNIDPVKPLPLPEQGPQVRRLPRSLQNPFLRNNKILVG